MRWKLLRFAAVVGLAGSLFTGALGGGSAAPGELANGSLFFPWVPNGEMIAGLGPFSSEVVIQNNEDAAVSVKLMTADGTSVLSEPFTLDPRASKTFTSADLGLPAGSGGGLAAVATWVDSSTALGTVSLAGVVKMVAANSIDGYTAPTARDVQLAAGEWVLPIVQTNSGWDSIIRVTNVAGQDVDVTAIYYAEDNLAGTELINQSLAAGETATVTASELLPAEAIGTVRISASGAVVANVHRMKQSTAMALTNVAMPASIATSTQAAPLVFYNYNGWNTGIDIANLADTSNDVTVTFYDYNGNEVATEQVSIGPKAMNFVYLAAEEAPAEGVVAAATVQGTRALAAVVDEVKYLGGAGSGHAMSYSVLPGITGGPVHKDLAYDYDVRFALPLIQRGREDGSDATSGINFFNAGDGGTKVYVQFVNARGDAVAPTADPSGNDMPKEFPLSALQGATVYTLSEMQTPFRGAAIVGVGNGGALTLMSNNVNYSVAGDGSAVFTGTLPVTYAAGALSAP